MTNLINDLTLPYFEIYPVELPELLTTFKFKTDAFNSRPKKDQLSLLLDPKDPKASSESILDLSSLEAEEDKIGINFEWLKDRANLSISEMVKTLNQCIWKNEKYQFVSKHQDSFLTLIKILERSQACYIYYRNIEQKLNDLDEDHLILYQNSLGNHTFRLHSNEINGKCYSSFSNYVVLQLYASQLILRSIQFGTVNVTNQRGVQNVLSGRSSDSSYYSREFPSYYVVNYKSLSDMSTVLKQLIDRLSSGSTVSRNLIMDTFIFQVIMIYLYLTNKISALILTDVGSASTQSIIVFLELKIAYLLIESFKIRLLPDMTKFDATYILLCEMYKAKIKWYNFIFPSLLWPSAFIILVRASIEKIPDLKYVTGSSPIKHFGSKSNLNA
jgi:hypothetical protein